MLTRKEKAALTPLSASRDPFALFRQMTADFERMFAEPAFPTLRWPFFRGEGTAWAPQIEVFEKENRLVTRVDLPGMKKEDVKVEVTDGQLVISGERKRETEEKKEGFYRSEREYGTFYRAVPLPEGAKLDDVKATFTDGVLEVSLPLPVRAEEKPKQIEIQETPAPAAKTAA
jgi:HSP20 family protein